MSNQDQHPNQPIPIACDMTALPDKAAHEADGKSLFAQVLSVSPLEDGYQFKFPITALSLAATFIDGERRCCPFFEFALQVPPAAETLHLQLTGGEGVKAFIEQEVLHHLPISVDQ